MNPLGQIVNAVQEDNAAILENLGMRVSLGEIPAYVAYAALRDRLAQMSSIRRWLSFCLRADAEARRWDAIAAVFDEFMLQGRSGDAA